MTEDRNLQERLDLVRRHTIYEVIHGSHAYGMNTPTSDVDKKGIALIPDDDLYFGGDVFEQQDGGWTDEKGNKEDKVIYSLAKFMNLATECNPNIIEVLFADESDILVMTPAGKVLRDNRHIFLSTKARHKFTGYAVSQLLRIKTHKRWIDNPVPQPKIEDFTHNRDFVVGPLGAELPNGAKILSIRKMTPEDLKLDPTLTPDYDFTDGKWHVVTCRVCDKSGYDSKKKDWDNYTTWRKNRNPARAALEEASGFDTKHAAHLVRLLRMGYEILTLGEVIVKRPDAKELLSIRNGAWTYEQVLAYAEDMDKKIEEAEKTSKLPRSPDYKKIKQLQITLTKSALHEAGSF
jgi:predicted nucleotidyltransferase